MRKTWLAATIPVPVCVLVGCAPTAEDMEKSGLAPMTAAEVTSFYSGKTIEGADAEGTKFAIYYDPSGTMRGAATWRGGSGRDQGVWWVTEDGQSCRRWDQWRDGQEGCVRLYDDGSKITFIPVSGSTKRDTTEGWTSVEGNPNNL